MGYVLRRIRAGYFSRPLSMELFFLPRSRIRGNWSYRTTVAVAHGWGAQSQRACVRRGKCRTRRRVLWGRPQPAHALHPELQPEFAAGFGEQGGLSSRVCRNERNQAIPLPRHQPAESGSDHRIRLGKWRKRVWSTAGVREFASVLHKYGRVQVELYLPRAANQFAYEQLARLLL